MIKENEIESRMIERMKKKYTNDPGDPALDPKTRQIDLRNRMILAIQGLKDATWNEEIHDLGNTVKSTQTVMVETDPNTCVTNKKQRDQWRAAQPCEEMKDAIDVHEDYHVRMCKARTPAQTRNETAASNADEEIEAYRLQNDYLRNMLKKASGRGACYALDIESSTAIGRPQPALYDNKARVRLVMEPPIAGYPRVDFKPASVEEVRIKQKIRAHGKCRAVPQELDLRMEVHLAGTKNRVELVVGPHPSIMSSTPEIRLRCLLPSGPYEGPLSIDLDSWLVPTTGDAQNADVEFDLEDLKPVSVEYQFMGNKIRATFTLSRIAPER